MGETTTVAFRIDESIKKEWEEAVESPEYNSLSHLIRLSVQKEISDTGSGGKGTEGSVEADGEIIDSLNKLEREVDSIQNEVSALSREDEAETLYDLEQVLLEILPEVNAIENIGSLHELDIDPAYPSELAGRIGAEEEEVTNALNRLAENTSQVRRQEGVFGEETGFWRGK
jgi:Arc/MetJ-type ribon-helix-helix transcriptional regulator